MDDRPEDRREPESPQEPAGIGSAEAGRAFLRALRDDLAGAGRRAARRAAALPSSMAAARSARPAPADGTRERYRRRSWRLPGTFKLAMLLVVGGTVAAAAAMLWAVAEVPLDRAVAGQARPSILVEAADGRTLARRGPFKLADVGREAYPQHLVDAVLSIEDRRFYHHWGIDFRGAMRALYRNIAAGRVVEGGSTITQQLVKIQMLGDERTMSRKLREGLLAVWLETQLDKDEILARYLNNLYLGSGAYGVPAAARRYFSKDVSELTLAEAAMLAGLIRAPSQFSPLRDYSAARQRAAIALDAMVDSGVIDAEAAEEAKAEPAEIDATERTAEADTWFADWAAEEALGLPGSFARNMRVRTTLDPELQRLAEGVVADMLTGPGRERGVSQAALVALRPDGAVLAMVGGRDYGESQFNRAVQGMRQPGSAFKVFVYYAALRNGYRPDDIIEDAPVDIDGWEPENFGREFHGQVTLADAFARSLNAATVQLALEVGIDEVAAAARDLGIGARLTETPSLALGASEVSLLDLTGAFASIRAGEMPVEPWGIAAVGAEESESLVAMGAPVVARRPLGAAHRPILQLLHGVVERGTGRRAALDGFAAGKTGTSQRFRDAWFIGFTEDLVVGVWVGNDDGTPMNEVVGGQLPAEMWQAFVTRATPLLPDDAPRLPPLLDDEAPEEPQMVAGLRLLEFLEEYEDYGDLDDFEDFEDVRGFFAERQAEWQAQFAERVRGVPAGQARRMNQGVCDIQACSRRYRSFRESDCTYQPYGGGPRRLCTEGMSTAEADEPVATGSVPQGAATRRIGQRMCNVSACAAQYRSFRASDCTYQPYGGGPRRICTR